MVEVQGMILVAARKTRKLCVTVLFGTVTVDDGQVPNNTVTQSFRVFLADTNIIPRISTIANQTVNEDTTAGPIAFTVSDPQSPADLLVISGTSSNRVLVPDANILFGGSGSNRTVTIIPGTNVFGTTLITVSVMDTNFARTNTSFLLTVNSVNDLPTISAVGNQVIDEDTTTAVLSFTVGDVETPAGSLTVAGSSSNTNVVHGANIVFGGSGTDRTVLISPVTNQFGTTHITITVTDGNAGSTSTGFDLTVNPVNDPPTVSPIGNQTINEDTATAAVPFMVTDADDAVSTLTMTGSSSNPGLVPDDRIVLSGSGTNRTVNISPLTNQFGVATITLTVMDPHGASSGTSFLLTVTSVNDLPTLDPIDNAIVNDNDGPQIINLTGINSGATNEDQTLTVTASSSNPGVVPNPTVDYTSPSPTGTLMFNPTPGTDGLATITVTVNDSQISNNIVTRTFTVKVNGTPRISNIPPQAINEDTTSAPIPFTVQAPVIPASNLLVTAYSSNPKLVPDQNLVLGGTGTNRTLTITPLPDQIGNAQVTAIATDTHGVSVNQSFQLAVNSVNDAPTLDSLANLSIDEDVGPQNVILSGITTGATNEFDTLLVTRSEERRVGK